MKLLLIKIGKAWNVLKRDGFVRGGIRVGRAFLGLFKKVEPGDILFISNGVGDSARYRTLHVAEELRNQGFHVSVSVQDNPFLLSYVDKFSVFVFHRVLYTEKVARFIAKLKTLKKEVIFETDDLVYDPEFLRHMDYYTQMNAFEKKLYENGLGGEIVNDPYVKTCTTTTTFLAEKLRSKGKQVFIVRNKLSEEDVKWGDKALSQIKKHPEVALQAGPFGTSHSPRLRMGYLSGTPSHNKDFATITPALKLLLEKYPGLLLVLVGPLDTGSELENFSGQIIRVPFLSRRALLVQIACLDINLAPLEMGNPFCESKSELKFFEAGLVGVPTVAAATGTFREAISDGEDGFVAASSEEWFAKLERLIREPELRKKMGENARQTTLMRYTTKATHETEYYNYLKEKMV